MTGDIGQEDIRILDRRIHRIFDRRISEYLTGGYQNT